MKKIISLIIAIGILFACDQKKTNDKVVSAKLKPESISVELDQNITKTSHEFKTKSGKNFIIKEEKYSASLSKITIWPEGFTEINDPINMEESDPFNYAIIADINDDGFDELYIITLSTGSGSYSTIYGFASNNDKSVTPIYIPKISNKNLKDKFIGYLGHDSIYVSNNKLFRKYPVYKEGDANCCPTGGYNTLQFNLKKGEANWFLEL